MFGHSRICPCKPKSRCHFRKRSTKQSQQNLYLLIHSPWNYSNLIERKHLRRISRLIVVFCNSCRNCESSNTIKGLQIKAKPSSSKAESKSQAKECFPIYGCVVYLLFLLFMSVISHYIRHRAKWNTTTTTTTAIHSIELYMSVIVRIVFGGCRTIADFV